MSSLDVDLDRKLAYDKEKGQLITTDGSGSRLVLAMPMEAFFGLVDHLFELFMSGASVILEGAGEGAGKAAVQNIMSRKDIEYGLRKTLSRGSRWGHGRYELLELDFPRNYSRLRVYNCVFARESDPECRSMWYLRGYLRGCFSTFFRNPEIICN